MDPNNIEQLQLKLLYIYFYDKEISGIDGENVIKGYLKAKKRTLETIQVIVERNSS